LSANESRNTNDDVQSPKSTGDGTEGHPEENLVQRGVQEQVLVIRLYKVDQRLWKLRSPWQQVELGGCNDGAKAYVRETGQGSIANGVMRGRRTLEESDGEEGHEATLNLSWVSNDSHYQFASVILLILW
jgi:hypothetical protein